MTKFMTKKNSRLFLIQVPKFKDNKYILIHNFSLTSLYNFSYIHLFHSHPSPSFIFISFTHTHFLHSHPSLIHTNLLYPHSPFHPP